MGKDDKAIGNKEKPSEVKLTEDTKKPKDKSKEKDKKKEKDPFEKMTVTELQKKIDETNKQINEEAALRERTIKDKKINIENKNKEALSLGNQNKNYMNKLENIKVEVDKQLKGLGLKEIQAQMKKNNKKEFTLDYQLDLKNKELANVNKLIKAFEKEKLFLEKSIKPTSFNDINIKKEKLAKLEKNNQTLEAQIQINNNFLKDNKKVRELTEKVKNDKMIIENEIKDFRLLIIKQEEINKENNSNLLKFDKEITTMKNELNEFKSKLPEIKISKSKHSANNIYNMRRSLSPKRGEIKEKIDFSKSLDIVYKFKFLSKPTSDIMFEKPLLFTAGEYELLKQSIPDEKLNIFQEKFNVALNEKITLQNKNMEEIKSLKRKQFETEEINEFGLINMKESEHKKKLLQFQINELKSESKLLVKKKSEIENTIKRLEKLYSEKVFENNLLTNQVKDMTKGHKEHLIQIQQEMEKKKRAAEEGEDEENEEEENDED